MVGCVAKAASSPFGSITGSSEKAQTVPEVPRLTVTTPARMLPVPIALIMLSPLPALTRASPARPHSSRRRLRNKPAGRFEERNGGSIDSNLGSMKFRIGLHHWRVRTSIKPVPEASPYSIWRSPVSQRLR